MNSGIDATNKLLQGLIDRVADTGWVDLSLSSANIIWTGMGQGRRIGNIVQLKFENIRSANLVDGEKKVVNKLPAAFVPTKQQLVPIIAVPSSGSIVGGYMTVRTDGSVVISPLANALYTPSYGVYAQVIYLV